jgi:hypothetical protein
VHVTGDDAGFYDLELAAANVNYLGRAMLAITDAAVHCPVFHEFMILPANVYDSLVLGAEFLGVDAHMQEFTITATTLQPKKPDGTTNTSYSRTLATDAAAQPIVSST